MPENVVICGGGVIGGAIAYFLARRGVAATIIESDAVAAGASGAAAGLLAPPAPDTADPSYQISRLGCEMHAELSRYLPDESGVDYEYAVSPRVALALSAEKEEQGRANVARLNAAGIAASWVDRHGLPGATGGVYGGPACGGAVHEGGARVDAYRYSLALVTAAERLGATVRSGAVTGLRHEDGKTRAVIVRGQEIAADVVVVAMGPWSQEASEWLGIPVPVEPLRGQIVKLRPARSVPEFCFGDGGNYASTKGGGVVFLGTTEERVGFDRGTTTEARDEIVAWGVAHAPELWEAEVVEQTACLRPLSRDGLPIMGRVPGITGAFIATGHGRKGILQSPPSGLAMAELILDGHAETLDLTPFDPARFGRDAK